MADPNQWMLDAGLRVVAIYGPRPVYGLPGRGIYEVQMSDGTYHDLHHQMGIRKSSRPTPYGRNVHLHRAPSMFVLSSLKPVMTPELIRELWPSKPDPSQPDPEELRRLKTITKEATKDGRWHRISWATWGICITGHEPGDVVAVIRADGTASDETLGKRVKYHDYVCATFFWIDGEEPSKQPIPEPKPEPKPVDNHGTGIPYRTSWKGNL
jgi:hypothetical protein